VETPSFGHVILDKSTIIAPFGVVLSLSAPANENLNMLIAWPGGPDLLDSIFDVESNYFIWNHQTPGTFRVMVRKLNDGSISTGDWTDGTPVFRAGQISDYSTRWNPKAEGFVLLLNALKAGKWADATLPRILSAALTASRPLHSGESFRSRGANACESVQGTPTDVMVTDIEQVIDRKRGSPANSK
jgi:hypothetical protein